MNPLKAFALALGVGVVLILLVWMLMTFRVSPPKPPAPEPPPPAPPTLDEGTLESIRAALKRGNKIEAIKLYREATGLGLKASKDFVEAMK